MNPLKESTMPNLNDTMFARPPVYASAEDAAALVSLAAGAGQTHPGGALLREEVQRLSVSVPEDVGYARTDLSTVGRQQSPVPGVRDEDLVAAAGLLSEARRVAMVVGGRLTGADGRAAVAEIAERIGASVYCAWRRFDAFPNTHPQFAGNLPWLSDDLLRPLRHADLVLAMVKHYGED